MSNEGSEIKKPLKLFRHEFVGIYKTRQDRCGIHKIYAEVQYEEEHATRIKRIDLAGVSTEIEADIKRLVAGIEAEEAISAAPKVICKECKYLKDNAFCINGAYRELTHDPVEGRVLAEFANANFDCPHWALHPTNAAIREKLGLEDEPEIPPEGS